MVANPKSFLVTIAEYLSAERNANEKSEYLDGVITTLMGASRNHNLIAANTLAEVSNQLRRCPCEVYPSDMRVHDPITRSFLYPDVVVVCNEPKFLDQSVDTLLNPIVVFEILSSSTERRDRGKKAWAYRQMSSVQEYVLVSQETPYIERFTRQEDGSWLLHDYQNLESSVPLDSIGVRLPLSEIYFRVQFSEGE